MEIDRAAGLNDVGMVAWMVTLRTPEYPEGRQTIFIANDITYQVREMHATADRRCEERGCFGRSFSFSFSLGSFLAMKCTSSDREYGALCVFFCVALVGSALPPCMPALPLFLFAAEAWLLRAANTIFCFGNPPREKECMVCIFEEEENVLVIDNCFY